MCTLLQKSDLDALTPPNTTLWALTAAPEGPQYSNSEQPGCSWSSTPVGISMLILSNQEAASEIAASKRLATSVNRTFQVAGGAGRTYNSSYDGCEAMITSSLLPQGYSLKLEDHGGAASSSTDDPHLCEAVIPQINKVLSHIQNVPSSRETSLPSGTK
jgi:hypothetical protein